MARRPRSKPTPKPEPSNETARTLTPHLRFPEFRTAPSWRPVTLTDLAHIVNERMPATEVSPSDYVSTESLLPDYGGMASAKRVPPSGQITRYRQNDVLVSNIRPYLKKVWRADREGGASNDVIVLRPRDGINPLFFSVIVANDSFIAYMMRGAKGVKMPRGDLDAMRVYPCGHPDPAEQKKIAACLTSLDDLIAAQGRKVEALKAHKKGLMQHLFPREGETRPRLRFPEFRDEWVKHRLESLTEDIVSGKDKLVPEGAHDLFGSTGVIGKTDFPSFRGTFLLVARVGANAGLLTKASGDFGVTDNTLVIIPKQEIDIEFVQYYLNSLHLNNMAFGSGQPLITGGQLKSLEICVPANAEQQRIADCLTSLDTTIAAEAAALAALRTHKAGLMQQLFPHAEPSP